jgi:hypothetical protein
MYFNDQSPTFHHTEAIGSIPNETDHPGRRQAHLSSEPDQQAQLAAHLMGLSEEYRRWRE